MTQKADEIRSSAFLFFGLIFFMLSSVGACSSYTMQAS
jgi:hypothetical protein